MPDDDDDEDDLDEDEDEDEDEDDGDGDDGDDDGYDLDGDDGGGDGDDDGEAKKVEITLGDIERLIRSHAPDLAEALKAFLEQDDPRPVGALPEGALDFAGLKRLLSQARATFNDDERRTQITDAWRRFLDQTNPPPPPRFLLADLLVKLYDEGSEPGRAALLELAAGAELKYGLWGGLKRIYKLAEDRHDAQVFGALAARFHEGGRGASGDVSSKTLYYLAKRSWRYLKQLGQAVPELYPQFAVETLRHVESTYSQLYYKMWGSWDGDPKRRRFDEAWKRSPDPLMVLLETCKADPAARFAILSLKRDFPQTLRNVTPVWLDRLARRPLESVHDFLVETLQASPEFHQGKLRSQGLHETVLALLVSPSKKARAYAIEYARAHAADLPAERLVELLERSDEKDTRKFAVEMLQKRSPKALGLPILGKLLNSDDTNKWAVKCFKEGFDRKEIPLPFVVDMLFGEGEQRDWADGYLRGQYAEGELDVGFWKGILDDKRAAEADSDALEVALKALGKLGTAAIGADWLLTALMSGSIGRTVWGWLAKADSLPGLDCERVKGLVFNAHYRPLALKLLGNPKLVKPKDLTLPWLLALARRADPSLHEFAHRYLLEHMKPLDFADAGSGASVDNDAGVARLFALATGDKEPEPVRLFAQTYLRCHHPGIGAEQPEAKALQLKAQVPRKAYTAERVWPALFDRRADVRKFAVAIARADLRRWGYHLRVYELAESEAREVRAIAFDALLKAGDPTGDPLLVLTPEELDAARVFAMTESRVRATREAAMELISRHYGRLGGPERLAWLMQSSDRTVRQLAVRLLWEKHRPRHLPPGWKPRAKSSATIAEPGEFPDIAALRDFLRVTLFGLPPGRSMEPREEGGPKRRLPASVAKRNAIEVVRDLGVEDQAFAQLAAPVLMEFTGSLARGEWQACVAALVRMRTAHPGVQLGAY